MINMNRIVSLVAIVLLALSDKGVEAKVLATPSLGTTRTMSLNLSTKLPEEAEFLRLLKQCRLFRPFFIWHTGAGEDSSFFLHRRLLVLVISELFENTSLSILTFGAENNIRQAGNTKWRDTVMLYKPGNVSKHGLTKETIRRTILNDYKSNNSNNAEIIYILVNSETEVDLKENDIEDLRKKKTFVISSGKQPANKKEIWLKIATDENHYIEFYEDGDIEKTLETILTLSCEDSMFICDTDKYWSNETGGCHACTYICSTSCKDQPEFCTRSCPYFSKVWLDKESNSKLLEHTAEITLICAALFLLLFVAAFAAPKRKRILRCFHVCRRMSDLYEVSPV